VTFPTPASADVVVIGGGIVGVSVAWNLARQGAGRVVLLERSTVAAGASGRTGALLRQHYSNRAEATLAAAGFRVFKHWPEIVGGEPVHTPWPLVVTVDTGPGREANLERLHRNVALQNEVGIPSRVISPQELADLQPYVRVDDLAAAALEPDSGYVDAVAATRGMAQAALRAGAEIHEGCPALGIVASASRVTGVRTPDGTIATGAVVCATGPWSSSLLEPIGVAVPIEALRVQVAVLQRPLALDAPHYVFLDTVAGFFCRPWGPGRTLVGVGGGDQHDPVDPDDYPEGNDPGYPALATAAIARRMPGMAAASSLHGHAGLYDMTPDAHPVIGPGGPDGLYLALGFSGAGFKKGPAVGQAVAELILDGRSSLVDLAPFALDRFASDAWRAPWSDSEYVVGSDFGHRL
jgi:sarcosine oxidase subunit beta